MKSDNTFNLVAKLSGEMDGLIMAALKEKGVPGLVSSHGSIVAALFGGRRYTMNALAEEIGKTPQTVTMLVKKLVQYGYLQCEKSAQDRRTTIVSLTPAGEALQPIFDEISEHLYNTQYRGFSSEDITTFRRLLIKMKANFDAEVGCKH